MRKLKIVLPAVFMIGMMSIIGCNKTTNNTTVVKDSIYYSPWMKLSMTFDATDSLYYDQISASKVTQSVLSTGAVLSYFGEVGVPNSGDTAVVDLIYYDATQFLSPGAIEIDAYGGDLSYTSNFPLLYRYVVIPGSILTTTALHNYTQQQLQKMSFTELQKIAGTTQQSSTGNTFNP